jgi:hypothetical protein
MGSTFGCASAVRFEPAVEEGSEFDGSEIREPSSGLGSPQHTILP